MLQISSMLHGSRRNQIRHSYNHAIIDSILKADFYSQVRITHEAKCFGITMNMSPLKVKNEEKGTYKGSKLSQNEEKGAHKFLNDGN